MKHTQSKKTIVFSSIILLSLFSCGGTSSNSDTSQISNSDSDSVEVSSSSSTKISSSAPLLDYDGIMNEKNYTEKVKANSYTISKDEKNYATFYATTSTKGIFVFAELYTDVPLTGKTLYSDSDSFEIGISTYEKPTVRESIYASTNGLMNFTEGYCGKMALDSKTKLYKASFELYVTYKTLGFRKSTDTIMIFQAKVNNHLGGYQSSFFDDASPIDYELLDENGFNADLVTTPIADSGDKWNSAVATWKFDGTEDFDFLISFENKKLDAYPAVNYNWVSEIYSPNWTNGGWTFRSDWWGWGTWNPGGVAGSCGSFYMDEWGGYDNFGAASKDMIVDLLYHFDSKSGTFTVSGEYHSKVTDYVDAVATIYYTSNVVSYRGEMVLGVGYDKAGITINGAHIINGSFYA